MENKKIIISPMRCFTCGKLIADVFLPYINLKEKIKTMPFEKQCEIIVKFFNDNDIELYCCRKAIGFNNDVTNDII